MTTLRRQSGGPSDRRAFLASSLALLPTASLWPDALHRVASALDAHVGTDAHTLASDEVFWEGIRRAWRLDPGEINLYASATYPATARAHDAVVAAQTRADRTLFGADGELGEDAFPGVRQRLAALLGCTPAELALTRNTTEGMNTVISGLDLAPGDEVVTTWHDYDSFLGAWTQREQRDGIVVRRVKVPYAPRSQQELLDSITAAFSARTKVLMFCHVAWVNGRIYPARDLCALARARGIQSIVDGAHGFAHVETDMRRIDCDYYAASLHKWLAAPRGTGLLYVRRDRIAPLWPLMGNWKQDARSDNIAKFESTGTIPPAFDGVAAALDLHERIGLARKRARLQWLKEYWVTRVAPVPHIRIRTSINASHSGGMAFVGVDGVTPDDLREALWHGHHIRVGTVHGYEGIDGVCVAMAPFTTVAELDRFVAALKQVARSGLP